MLSPYRVIDLTDERGQLAGLMLAQLGADVIAVEPPGGSSSRSLAPFAGDAEDPDHSLWHWAYNRGKRSVVLDVAGSADDRAAFLRLVAGADVLIDSAAPGELAALGLGPAELARINPALVHASITAFGQDGPKAGWAATDLTVWAAAGPMALTGDTDRAPLRPSLPQAFAHAAAESAGAIIAALFERSRSGLGQHIDVSAQQASAQATQSGILCAPNNATVVTRGAGSITIGPITLQVFWPCADGYVSVAFLFGTAIGPMTARLMHWICEEGFCDEATRDKDWVSYAQLLMTGAEPMAEFDRVKAIVGEFCAAHTKAELLAGSTARRVLIAPVNMIDDVVGLDHLTARDYWDDVDGVRYPGPMAKLTGTPLPRLGPPPRLGADTAAVLGEPPRSPFAPPPVSPAPTARPLEGVKVLDFMWVMAGPATTRVLADLGATIVRVESSHRVETGRTLIPFKNDENGLEASCLFANLNAGKLGFSIDPTDPTARDVIHDLVRWADVVTESFSPKAMKGWGLDYESLRTVNPRIVMLSSCLFGQTGPLANFAGFGTMAAAMSGFFGITGWPDRWPSGPFGAYTDYISPRFSTAVLLAALDHQRRTGQGQYIDFAQVEAAIHALAPAVLDHTVNGRVWQRAGNADPRSHPHGVFPSAGDDRWIAIACRHDEDRAALGAVTGGLDDEAITTWTRARSDVDAMHELQSVGVPAHAVQNSPEAWADPHLAHRGHFHTVAHPLIGDLVIEGPRARLSRTPARVTAAGPMLGQHTPDVLTEILGYDDDRFAELLTSPAFE